VQEPSGASLPLTLATTPEAADGNRGSVMPAPAELQAAQAKRTYPNHLLVYTDLHLGRVAKSAERPRQFRQPALTDALMRAHDRKLARAPAGGEC
jgi:hypothetical protein